MAMSSTWDMVSVSCLVSAGDAGLMPGLDLAAGTVVGGGEEGTDHARAGPHCGPW